MATRILPIVIGAAVLGFGAHAASAGTLDDVKAKGFVQCGVNGSNLAGFGAQDSSGNWTGLDADLCKGVAAAVFGDATKVKFTPLSAKDRFPALQSGEIDMLARNTTWSASRDSQLGFDFRAINYYDGQGFMVKKELGVKSALELNGASVCVQSGTTTELNLADYFRANKMEFKPVVFEAQDEADAAYNAGRCDVYTTDQSGLYSIRLKMANPDDHVVLPEIISKEPLGPAVRQNDSKWFDVVSFTHYAMVTAEEFGITQANVEEMKKSENPDIKRFLGEEANNTIGADLGLPNDWAVQIIKAVGNYGEVFERNVGTGSPLKIERGLNALWNKGGLQYAPPIR
ncbi:amino acid ABC transporter substrate-bindnig protein [Rhizobium sp. Leaf384]|uniref:amino acid ABC transporter substrate-binding protein n=1 Tax=unclassified Rhizobium TaxID=2613769 RepID=UPI0007154DD7|nr:MULTISPECIES: amino acid ABC transporter substrate-binding protein [unclassified Rhizobium]KQR68831.1 amino acid ABC transporter substrate-bindnig protein [Rhizobium sp. Leaf341]KQS79245.1 amino acid ABC transporter substrate-bindnig protein [Rhizobium sp. Leaf384]KQS82813.1 amino acid ABC transporter substrate-bindnig protein [Rhizobium sp. Leaf383]